MSQPARDFAAVAAGYARDVAEGRVPACRWIKLACRRFLDDIARAGEDPGCPWAFDAEAGARPCRFLELLPHTKGKWGAERQLIRLEPWQVWIVVNVFGFRRKKDGTRRFRTAMVMVSRKNGKSILAAGLGLYMLVADGEHGAEVYCAATSQQQALEVFRPARLMALGTPALLSRFGVEVNAQNLHVTANASRFEPLIGKPGDGASPSFGILDEFHEAPDATARDTLLTGMGARQQPLLFTISTAGSDLAGPCYDDVLTGRKLLEGAIEDDERFFCEYTVDGDVPWESPEALRMANPNLGVSVSEDFLLARQREAVRNARDQGRFKTKHLGLFVNARSAYFNMSSWQRCRDPALDLGAFAGKRCYIGADLASKQDIAAVQLLFPMEDGSYRTFGRYYLPEDVVTEPGREHYAGWHLDGRLIATEGNMIDHAMILGDIIADTKRFQVEEVVFDPAQATWVMGALTERRVPVFEFAQHARNYSEPMKQVAALIDGGKLLHGDPANGPMTWMMSNVVSRTNAKDEVFPAKEKPEMKIDGPVALIMAMARAMANASRSSVYNDAAKRPSGLLVFG